MELARELEALEKAQRRLGGSLPKPKTTKSSAAVVDGSVLTHKKRKGKKSKKKGKKSKRQEEVREAQREKSVDEEDDEEEEEGGEDLTDLIAELKAEGVLRRGSGDDDDDDDDDDDSEEEEEQQQEQEEEPKQQLAYNLVGLRKSLASIELPSEWAWIEHASVTSATPIELDDANDDLKREALFYQHTLSNVKQGISNLDQAGIPYRRPADYFAEMLKSDQHMARVKDALIFEKKKMTAVEDRAKHRENLKYSKQLATQRAQERHKQKRSQLEAISRWRKQHKNDEMSVERSARLEEIIKDVQHKRKKQPLQRGGKGGSQGPPTKSRKRRAKDARYGNGGKKRKLKKNDAKSVNDMSSFHHSQKPGSGNGKSRSKGKSKTRPGKGRRQQKRGRRG